MTNNLTVSKEKRIIDAGYSMNIVELRLILAGISQINPFMKLTDETEIYLTPDEYSSLFHVSLAVARNDLKKALVSLYNRSVVIDNPLEEREFRWLNEKIIKKQDGAVGMTFNKKVIPYLIGFQDVFASYKLKEISRMKSPQSIRIYEILIQFKVAKKRVVSVEWLKKQLMLTEKYKRFYDFEKYVLLKAINEINEHSDITVKTTYKKKGRSVTDIIFSFQFKEASKSKTKAEPKSKTKTPTSLTNKIIDENARRGETKYQCADRLVATGEYSHSSKPKSNAGQSERAKLTIEDMDDAIAEGIEMGLYGDSNLDLFGNEIAVENIKEMKCIVSN